MTGCYFGPTQPLDSESSRQIEHYFAHRQVRLNSGLEPPIPYPMMVGLETILKWRSLLTPTPPGQCNVIEIVTILKKMILKPKPGWYPASLVLLLSLILGSEILAFDRK